MTMLISVVAVLALIMIFLFYKIQRSKKQRRLHSKGALEKAFNRYRPKAWLDGEVID